MIVSLNLAHQKNSTNGLKLKWVRVYHLTTHVEDQRNITPPTSSVIFDGEITPLVKHPHSFY